MGDEVSEHSLSKSVEATEDVVGELAAADGGSSLALGQLALTTLGQFGRHVRARSVLHERFARLLATSFGRAAVQRLVLEH